MKRFFSWLFAPSESSLLERELQQYEEQLRNEVNPKMREALLITIRDIEIQLYSRPRKNV